DVSALALNRADCNRPVKQPPYAGIPPPKPCINGHSQIWNQSAELEPVRESFRSDRSIEWIKVHDLPDFVYFNHSIHVAKGVGCETCHGRIDRMPLVSQHATLHMSWCVDCHRNPQPNLRPRDQIFTMGYVPAGNPLEVGAALAKDYGLRPSFELTNCTTCHR